MTIERIKGRISNIYLITDGKSSLLIDTGCPSDGPAVCASVKNQSVRLILLTHGHVDHAGGASMLAAALQVPVAMSRDDAELLDDPDGRQLFAHSIRGKLLLKTSRLFMDKHPYSPPVPNIWLEDGQELSDFGIKARILALPGHTKGSVGVLTEAGDLFAGDAVFNYLRPSAALVYEHGRTMKASAEKILRARVKRVFPGHGRPLFVTENLSFS